MVRPLLKVLEKFILVCWDGFRVNLIEGINRTNMPSWFIDFLRDVYVVQDGLSYCHLDLENRHCAIQEAIPLM